jgi:hypothetical protein
VRGSCPQWRPTVACQGIAFSWTGRQRTTIDNVTTAPCARLRTTGSASSKRGGFLGIKIYTKLSCAPALTSGQEGSRRYVALIVARNLLTSCLR